MTLSETISSADQKLFAPLERMAKQLDKIGLSTAVHDSSGRAVLACTNCSEVCQRICAASGPAHTVREDALKQVWSDGNPQMFVGPAGCVVMATPVVRRRRMVAVAMTCYLTPDAGAQEEFARTCDRLHLDREYMASVVQAGATHPASEAGAWMEMVQMLLNQGVENSVAQNELASFSSNLSTTYEELSLLYRLSGAMRVNVTPEEFFKHVCDELREVTQVGSTVAVLNGRQESNQKDRIVRSGEVAFNDVELRELADEIRDRNADADDDGRGVVLNGLSELNCDCASRARNLIAVPLVAGDLYMGMVLAIDKADEGEFDSADMKLIHSVSVQAAVFLANHHLYGEVQGLLMGVLHVLTASIDAKDEYTCGHSQRVALISRRLAEMCGFNRERVENIYLAGLLHDIGKIGVPEAVLCKPGRLSSEEFDTMKRHPVIGANILSNIRQIKTVMPGVLYHHERVDGRGYPEGRSGEMLPIEGRIVGIADSFDAMTSSRTYRQAMPLEFVVAEIMRCSGTQFDPMLVDHLLSLDLEGFLAELREAKPVVSAVDGVFELSE